MSGLSSLKRKKSKGCGVVDVVSLQFSESSSLDSGCRYSYVQQPCKLLF